MEINYKRYAGHPRILEIRIALLYTMLEREYGTVQAMKFFETIADNFYCDYNKLMTIINKRFDIRRASKTNRMRWRQEVIFMARCLGLKNKTVMQHYLDVTPKSVYNHPELYKPENFVTPEWLLKLERDIQLAGAIAYQKEIERFLEVVDNLQFVLNKWVCKGSDE